MLSRIDCVSRVTLKRAFNTAAYSSHFSLPEQLSVKCSCQPNIKHRLMIAGNNDNLDEKFNMENQKKVANLGKIVEAIKLSVPNMLITPLPKEIISKDILLRVWPTHFQELNAYVPTLKGHMTYYATARILQLILTSVVLNPKVKLHIKNIKVSLPNDESNPVMYSVYPYSTKVIVKWTTCMEGCFHLSSDTDKVGTSDSSSSMFFSTSEAKFGKHSWSKVDTTKIFTPNVASEDSTKPSLSATIEHLFNSLVGLSKESNKLERIIDGIFIFELNDQNDKITVHTVENIEIIEKRDPESANGELTVC